MRKRVSCAVSKRNPRITTGRKSGASILSIVTDRCSCRAFHQIQSRSTLETSNGVDKAPNTNKRKATTNRTTTDGRFRNRIDGF